MGLFIANAVLGLFLNLKLDSLTGHILRLLAQVQGAAALIGQVNPDC